MELLKQLQIQDINAGAFSGQGWHSEIHKHTFASFSPTNGEKLAEVAPCTMDDYEQVMSSRTKCSTGLENGSCSETRRNHSSNWSGIT